jgi:hypothetical protein
VAPQVGMRRRKRDTGPRADNRRRSWFHFFILG